MLMPLAIAAMFFRTGMSLPVYRKKCGTSCLNAPNGDEKRSSCARRTADGGCPHMNLTSSPPLNALELGCPTQNVRCIDSCRKRLLPKVCRITPYLEVLGEPGDRIVVGSGKQGYGLKHPFSAKLPFGASKLGWLKRLKIGRAHV